MSHHPRGAPLGNHGNLSPCYFDTHSPSHLSVGLLPTNLDLRHMSLYIPLDTCFVSQFARCFYVSLRELIVSCSIFENINSLGFPFLLIVMIGWNSWSKMSRLDDEWINIFEKSNWIMEIVLALCPLCLLTSHSESRDEILVSWG